MENEKVSSSLILEKTLGTPDGRKVRIWMNHDAWPEAVFLNPKAREVNLPLKEKCEHDRFLCKDFSLVPSFRLPKDTIHLVQHHGDLSLQLPPAPFPRLLWISQMFRKGWVATTKGQRLEVFPLFEHTIGISVPPNVNEINLKFKPTARRLTTFFSEGSLFSSILILIGLYWRQRVSKNIKIV
ncbi:MAG: hypothetical protein HY747_09915 [Elusimicrobia bacterium]|nr:hypothetical protein [Elusimicrobiota bacterium]